MKRVSFKVAKAIKEAGYPQENIPCYITESCIKEYDAGYDGDMPIIKEIRYTEGQYLNVFGYIDKECNPPHCYAPTSLDVWLWLWREKNIYIQVGINCCTLSFPWGDSCTFKNNSPEDSIIEVIEYLVTNNLIK